MYEDDLDRVNDPIDLTEFDEDFEQTQPAEKKDFEPVPNGRYQAKVDKVYLGRSKTSGDPMLKWELVIISGKYAGRRLFRNNMIATKENLSWLKTDLGTAGLTIQKTSDLHNRLGELLDVVVEVSVRNYKEGDRDYQNVYLNKRLDIEVPERFKQGHGPKGNQDAGKSAADLAF